MRDQRMSVTYLGRGLGRLSKTTKKHDIKRANRLIGNPRLHAERLYYYQYMATQLIGNQTNPIVLLDWSPINGQSIFQVLRASIPIDGRSLVLFETTFSENQLNSPSAHQQVLDGLEQVLPEGATPIIVADAMFRSPWFRQVEQKGWYWVSRLRGQVSLAKEQGEFQTSYQWFEQAKEGVHLALGKTYFGKKAKHPCEGVLYKRSVKGRAVKKMRGGISNRTNDKHHKKDANEPWLLVYRLPKRDANSAELAVSLYSQRFKIEEGFRDVKNGKLGMGLEYANSKCIKRFDNLLLIAALAMFHLWCIGSAAKDKGLHRSLQANSIRHRRVLSILYLGREVCDDHRYQISLKAFVNALRKLREMTITLKTLPE